MSIDDTLDRAKVTVLTLWDDRIFPGRMFHLDAYTNATGNVELGKGSLYKNDPSPEEWWNNQSDQVECLFPERVVDPKRYRSNMKPHTVIEIYSTPELYVTPEVIAEFFTSRFDVSWEIFLRQIRPFWTSTQPFNTHTMREIELEQEVVKQALERMVSAIPPHMLNQVVRNYQKVGEYTIQPVAAQ